MRIVSGLIGLAVVVGVALLVVGTVEGLAPLRRAAIERLLSAALDAPVEIEGPVAFDLGPTLVVTGSKVRIAQPEDQSDTIDEGEIGLRLSPLLAGRIDVTDLVLKGVRLSGNSTLVGFDPDAPADDGSDDRWFGIVPGVIRLAHRADIAVSDVQYRYLNPESGWEFDISVASIATSRNAEGGATTIAVSGVVNGTPLTIDGDIHTTAAGDAFTLTASAPEARLEVRSVARDDPEPSLDAIAVSTDLGSIGSLLDALKIARTVEGTARLTATIDTSGDDSSVRNLDATAALDNGPTFKVTGAVADLEAREGFDLAVDAEWPVDGASVDEDGLLAFQIYSVTGRLTGDIGTLTLTDGWITTNLFSDAIPRLGPITASAVRRDEQGRVAVEGVRVLAGPQGDPTFDLTGRIGDLLQLADFRLEGGIAMPVADMLRLKVPDPAALGRLTGKFAFSDASGEAGVDTLTARLTGSGLVSADVQLVADQTRPTETGRFALSVDVPDYARLARAIGLAPEPVGGASFKGDVALSERSGEADGSLRFGQTQVTGDLAIALDARRPLVTGSLSTPVLVLADARRFFDVVSSIRRLQEESGLSRPATHAQVERHPRFDLDVEAGRVEGVGAAVSGVSGRVRYDEGLVTANSFVLQFDEGHFGFDGHMQVRDPNLPFSARGEIARWPLGKALEEMGVDLPITGTLQSKFDISSSGTSVRAAIANARGDLYARVVHGVIGNRLLDLSGLVLPSWLFAPSAKAGVSNIDCFSAKFDFSPGLAVLQSAVVETEDVIVTATGRIDFKRDTIDIEAHPKALAPNLIPIVSPFAIRGPLSEPKVVVEGGGVAGRAVAEALALPFNTLGTLLGVDRSGPKPRRPANAC